VTALGPPLPSPAEVVEAALAASRTEGCVAVVEDGHRLNLRWAGSMLTTNGHSHSRSVTVVALHGRGRDACAGAVTRPVRTADDVVALVYEAEQVARRGTPEESARDLLPGTATDDAGDPPAPAGIEVFAALTPALRDVLERSRADGTTLSGYAEQTVTTTYLGTSTGTRHRHVQPSGHLTMTATSPDGSASAWAGVATRDFSEVDAHAVDAQLRRRLGWASTTVDLTPGRYPVILPPTAVADLMIYAYWEMGGLAASEGRTAYADPGRGTLVGTALVDPRVTMRSDPSDPALAASDVLVTSVSHPVASVFDNGLRLPATTWVDHGTLNALVQTRHSGDLTGLPVTPLVDNLLVEVDGGAGDVDALVARCDDGVLLTSLWYIRMVDPPRMLLTGLTRDGVYVVRGGEVVGAAGNFRFNDSPIELLRRVQDAGSTEVTFSREWGEYFPRAAMPPLRVADFHFSTGSDAR
jgi:predicted Zn-dependent protease